MGNQNQSWFACTRFPSPDAGCMYLLRILIGSLCCLRLLWFNSQNDYFSFDLRHSTTVSALHMFKGRFPGPVQISCDFFQFSCRGRISFGTSKMRRLSWAFLVTRLFTFLFQAQKRPISNVNRRLFWKWRKQEDNWTGSELRAARELHRGIKSRQPSRVTHIARTQRSRQNV